MDNDNGGIGYISWREWGDLVVGGRGSWYGLLSMGYGGSIWR